MRVLRKRKMRNTSQYSICVNVALSKSRCILISSRSSSISFTVNPCMIFFSVPMFHDIPKHITSYIVTMLPENITWRRNFGYWFCSLHERRKIKKKRNVQCYERKLKTNKGYIPWKPGKAHLYLYQNHLSRWGAWTIYQ